MSDKVHLLIPGAVLPPEAAPAAGPMTPHLRALLAAMAPAGRIDCDDDSPAMPHELALARFIGLPGAAGRIPWAAHETGTLGTPCAWIVPCHWSVGSDHILLTPGQSLTLDEATSRALLAAVAPYFLEDGIELGYQAGVTGLWLARGEVFRTLATISMERLAGRRLTAALFDAPGIPAATLRRLQNEMQMLLYTHPVNDERLRQGLLPVNSFWVAGAGMLERPVPPAPDVQVESRLHAAAIRRDAAAHAQAWREVDADTCASLLALLHAGGDVRLTLCGARAAQTFEPVKSSVWRRITSVFGLQPLWDGCEQL